MSLHVRTSTEGAPFVLVDDEQGPVTEANRFLTALHVRGLSVETIRTYAFDLLVLYRWLDGRGKKVQELKQSDLHDFLAAQRSAGAQPNSINHRLTVARLLHLFCVGREPEGGAMTSLPAAHYAGSGRDRDLGLHQLPKPSHLKLRVKVPKTLVEPLTAEQVREFLSSLRRYRDVVIVQLMLLCGLRSREVLGMRLEDVCFTESRLRIRGKGDKERALPLPHIIAGSISGYLRFERPTGCRCSRLLVVLQGKRRGQPMSPAGLRSLFRHRRRSLLGIANANAHRFRHTFGADMARCGVRLPVLQKMMGHARAATTLQYINLSMADIAAEFERAMAELQRRYDDEDDESS